MATLWLREYQNIAGAGQRAVPCAMEPGTADQTVTFTTSTQSAAFNASTRLIEVISTVAFHYAVGSNPTATTSSQLVPANTHKAFGVTPGHKVAVITAA